MPTTLDTSVRPEDRFVSAFKVNHGEAINGTNASISKQRTTAIERFADLGIPTHDQEAWKYTDIATVLDHPYTLSLATDAPPVTQRDIEPLLIDGLDAHRLVLVNGRVDASLSDVGDLPDGAVVSGLADAGDTHPDLVEAHYGEYVEYEDEALTALNTAFVQDGVFLYVPEGTHLEKPILILELTSADADRLAQPRHLFIADDGAGAKVIQRQHSLSDVRTFTNSVTEAFVGEKGNLQVYITQDEGPAASRVQTIAGYQKPDSVFTTHTTTLSGEVVRNNITVTPDGQHCESNLFGLVLGRGDMHVDNHTLVDHVQPDCVSNELYKHILNERATAVFNGKVLVRQDSQRINAYQSNDSIVLTNTAQIYTKPELEIYADDVQCSHGATAGQLDKEGLFYLRSRGLDEDRARTLMLQAFASDVVEEITIDVLHDVLASTLRDRLARKFA